MQFLRVWACWRWPTFHFQIYFKWFQEVVCLRICNNLSEARPIESVRIILEPNIYLWRKKSRWWIGRPYPKIKRWNHEEVYKAHFMPWQRKHSRIHGSLKHLVGLPQRWGIVQGITPIGISHSTSGLFSLGKILYQILTIIKYSCTLITRPEDDYRRLSDEAEPGLACPSQRITR